MANTYTIATAHNTWSKDHAPAVTVDPGDIVVFDTPEITKGQLGPHSTVADLTKLDFGPIHQICGPVSVRGAEPGDTLVVEILDIRPKSWAWSAIIPGFSLLAEDAAFSAPYLHIWDLTPGDHAVFKPGIVIPFEPFCGVMGVAPAEDGALNTIPPRRNGGNLDIRQLVAGSVAFFPVLAPGALFSCGDVHAAQGDGEVCGTGLECEATVTLRFGLQKGREIPELEFRMPSRMTGSWNTAGWHCVTRHGPDLMENSKNAIRGMIDFLGREHGLTPQEAFVLCSACVDLKISEVVDAPNWIVTAALPLGIFQH